MTLALVTPGLGSVGRMIRSNTIGEPPDPEPPDAAALTSLLLTGSVARLLPVGQRRRYAEEFRSELRELAPRSQVAYAVRLIGRSWSLRRSLAGR
ncbi:MAG TPA: hypothetical protein VHW44_21730 [Pseudonocardiaceae bacterium]|jgi:hypothetical protein|nr:hypothetical protein [Pseudonocardiaceae bacterium]